MITVKLSVYQDERGSGPGPQATGILAQIVPTSIYQIDASVSTLEDAARVLSAAEQAIRPERPRT